MKLQINCQHVLNWSKILLVTVLIYTNFDNYSTKYLISFDKCCRQCRLLYPTPIFMTSSLCHLMRALVAAGRGKGGKNTKLHAIWSEPIVTDAATNTPSLVLGLAARQAISELGSSTYRQVLLARANAIWRVQRGTDCHQAHPVDIL
jgi:hypothetical protein